METHGGRNFKGEGFAVDGVEIVGLFGRIFDSELLVENEILIEGLKEGTKHPKLETSWRKIVNAFKIHSTHILDQFQPDIWVTLSNEI